MKTTQQQIEAKATLTFTCRCGNSKDYFGDHNIERSVICGECKYSLVIDHDESVVI